LRASAIIAICLIALLLAGCITKNGTIQKPFGFKDEQDCGNLPTDAEKVSCLHVAAVSDAYLSSTDPTTYSDRAVQSCEDIVNNIGSQHPNDDIGKQADTERNVCLFDVAKIVARETGNPGLGSNICADIVKGNYETAMAGSDATQQDCMAEVTKLSTISARNYYSSDNICTVVFILPPLLLISFYLGAGKRE
jgi:hypothetical protein